MSPERSGSPQDDQATTPKMSVPASPVAGTPTREAQSPISLLLAVAHSQSTRNGDDDLTNLAWLHERDLLRGEFPPPVTSQLSLYLSHRYELGESLPHEQRALDAGEVPQQQPHPVRSAPHERLRGRVLGSRVVQQLAQLSGLAAEQPQEASAQHPLRPAGAHVEQAAVLLLVSHFHGDRGFRAEGAAREGDLRVDPRALPVLQERADRLEEQREA